MYNDSFLEDLLGNPNLIRLYLLNLGPVYLPKHIYNMLSEYIKKELDKYNHDKKAQYKPTCTRMAKVHDQEVDDSPDHSEPDLEH